MKIVNFPNNETPEQRRERAVKSFDEVLATAQFVAQESELEIKEHIKDLCMVHQCIGLTQGLFLGVIGSAIVALIIHFLK